MAAQNKKKGLRITSSCTNLEEFKAAFRPLCTPSSIFIGTKSPRPSGSEVHFAVTLKDGKPLIRGRGKITDSFITKTNRYGRPGMVITFVVLDSAGRKLVNDMTAAPPAKKREVEDAKKTDEGAKRVPGSSIILPANPFGSLAADSLEAFVECTLYEHTGELDLAELGLTDGNKEASSSSVPESKESLDLASFARNVIDPKPAIPIIRAIQEPTPADPGATTSAALSTPPPADPVSTPPPADPVAYTQGQATPTPWPSQGYTPPPDEHSGSWAALSRFTGRALILSAGATFIIGLLLGLLLAGGGPNASTTAKAPPAQVSTPPQGEGSADKAAAKTVDLEGSDDQSKVEAAGGAEKVAANSQADLASSGGPVVPESNSPEGQEVIAEEVPKEATGVTTSASSSLCSLRLDIQPAAAIVSANGKRLAAAEEHFLSCGKTVLRFQHPRYAANQQTLALVRGEPRRLSIRLKRPSITLKVLTAPKGAQVKLNNRVIGNTPLTRSIQAYERVKVTIASPGYQSFTTMLYPEKNKTYKGRLRKNATRKRSPTRKRSRTKKR